MKNPTETSTNTWMSRFGILEDVTDRKSGKGPYITFKLQAKGFIQYGACFEENLIEQIKAAVGQSVWMKGPLDTRMGQDADGNPREMKSFKVHFFKLSEPRTAKSDTCAAA